MGGNGMWFFPVSSFALRRVATDVLRVTGHHYLQPDHALLAFLTFAGTVPLIAVATFTVNDWRRIDLPDRPAAAILMSLPGLFLNVIGLFIFSEIYPNLPGAETLFGAWLLWAYAMVLVSGVVPYTRMWGI